MKKIETVKSTNLFNDIIQKGNKVKSRYFILCYVKNDLNKNYFGVAVGKKVGNAVIRNKLKRQIRNLIDENKLLFKKSYNYIIIGKKECLNATFENMNNDLKKMISKGENHEK